MESEHFTELDALGSDYWWFATRYDAVWRLGTLALGKTPSSVIDFGCGTGNFLSWLIAEKGLSRERVLGFDASELGLAAAARRGVRARPLDLDQPDVAKHIEEAPDWIVMLDVLEHLAAPVDALRAAHLAARPGGVLIVTVPAMPVLWSTWDERLGHYRRYTAATLRSDLSTAGWDVGQVQYLFFSMVFPALVRRVLSKRSSKGDPGFPRLSPAINSLVSRFTRAEARLGRLLPGGTSLVAAARRLD